MDETGERFYEARLLGLQGDILLLRGGVNAERDAETAYLKSLEVARQQGAKVWESWSRLSEQIFRVDKWSVHRG